MGSYFSVIKAIAAGNSKLSAIASMLEVKATSLTKYLKNIDGFGYTGTRSPLSRKTTPEKSKKGLYKIKDNYIRFWFAFIYPNRSFIESGNSRIVMDKIHKGLITNPHRLCL